MRMNYQDSIIEYDDDIIHSFVLAEDALCPDGKRRNARPSGTGTADTFYSIPAFVYAKDHGRTVRVYGYVTVDTLGGSTVASEDDPLTVKFRPYIYREHFALVGGQRPHDDIAPKESRR